MSEWVRYLGYLLLLNGAWMLVQRVTARGSAIGRIVDFETRTPSSVDIATTATTLYHAVIEFADGENQRRRFTAVGGDTEPTPRRGTRVRVRYRPGNPDDAYIATFTQMWIMPILWLTVGALAIVFSY